MTSTPEQIYRQQCTALGIKANSSVVEQLPKTAEEASQFRSWDLRNNMVGSKGAVAILRTVEACLPNLTSINFSGNNLQSPVCKDMLAALVKHPNIQSIDVSRNDVRLGGPELVDLVKRNRRIVELNIQETFLRPLFERLIAIHLRRNQTENGPSHKKSVDFVEPGRNGGGDDDEAFGGGDPFGNFGDFQRKMSGENHVQFETESGGGRRVPRRPTVSAEVIDESDLDKFEPEKIDKDPAVRVWLKNLLERHDFFSHLEDFELYVAVDAMVESERPAGSVLFEAGDDESDQYYIVGSGEVEISKGGDDVKTLKKGDGTQDLMLLYPQPCTETAVVKQDAVIYMLDRQTYRCVLAKSSKKKRAMYEGFLQSVGFLKGLAKGELLQLADALKPCSFEPGSFLIHYGEVGETFYLIVEGVVEVFGRDDAGKSIKVCEFTVGENVGELEFLHNHKCVADVKAKGHVRAAKMNRHHFEMVMGPVKEVLARVAATSEVYTYYRQQLEKMEQSQQGKH